MWITILIALCITGDQDYVSFNEVITLFPGDNTFSLEVEILPDMVSENNPEMFQAQLSIEGQSSSLTLDSDNDVATVTITDISSMLNCTVAS